MASQSNLPIALTIAGSDSGGGAGIQADIKTFSAFGVFGTSVVTAITAQNTIGVRAVHPIPLEIVRAQLEAVIEDLPPVAVKTGMLATAPLVSTVADAIRRHELQQFVLDPVMVATSGDRLLDEDALNALRNELLPLATLITPNLEEARILTGLDIGDEEGALRAARHLVQSGARAVLLKGGHGLGREVVDILLTPGGEWSWRRPRIDTRNTHGTGCTLAAAITAGLAQGSPLPEAVERGLTYVAAAIAAAPELGSGHGPLNHFVAVPPGRG